MLIAWNFVFLNTGAKFIYIPKKKKNFNFIK